VVNRSNRRPSLAEQVAAGRELIVLVDGPWARRWYWTDDFADMQQAARRYPPQKPAGELQNYQRTEHTVGHPGDHQVSGIAYRFREPTPASVTSPRMAPAQPQREGEVISSREPHQTS
jgi:hypothetical protein